MESFRLENTSEIIMSNKSPPQYPIKNIIGHKLKLLYGTIAPTYAFPDYFNETTKTDLCV